MTTRAPALSPPDFSGCVLRVRIPGQQNLTGARKRNMQQCAASGVRSQRIDCAVADGVYHTMKDVGFVDADGREYTNNPKSRAQFGAECKHGEPFLTFGARRVEDGSCWTFKYLGSEVPIEMIEAAVRHDHGDDVPDISIDLPLSDATVYETGTLHGKRVNDPRKNHDTGKDGKPYPRPARLNHKRLCADDLRSIRKARKQPRELMF